MKINRYLSHWHLIQYFSYYFRLGDCMHASGDKKYRHMRYVSILVLSWTPSTKHWKGRGDSSPSFNGNKHFSQIYIQKI